MKNTKILESDFDLKFANLPSAAIEWILKSNVAKCRQDYPPKTFQNGRQVWPLFLRELPYPI